MTDEPTGPAPKVEQSHITEATGRRVVFKQRFPLKDNRRLAKAMAALTNQLQAADDWQVTFLTQVIESWEYDGDPHDPKSYENLDAIYDIMPLAGQAAQYLMNLEVIQTKN